MKLYETAMTPSCRRVSLFLNELGIDIERVALNVREGDNLSADYAAKAVNGKVPMLELDSGETLCESVAICRYVDEQFPNSLALFGQDPLEKAQVEMWHRVVELQGLYAGFQAFRNLTGVYSDRERCVKEWGEESKKRVEEFLPVLNQRLSESAFVASSRFTIVDITAFIFVGFCTKGLELDVLAQYPAISTWFNSVAARPAFQA